MKEIEFELHRLCLMCISQMVLLANNADKNSTATALRANAFETVQKLRHIQKEAQQAIEYLEHNQ